MSWRYLSCFCKKIAAAIWVLASNVNWLEGLATILTTRWTCLISSTTWSGTTWLFGSTRWIHEWVLYSRLTSSTTWVGTSHLSDWTWAWLTGYCWRTSSGWAWEWKCLWFYFRISAGLLESPSETVSKFFLSWWFATWRGGYTGRWSRRRSRRWWDWILRWSRHSIIQTIQLNMFIYSRVLLNHF